MRYREILESCWKGYRQAGMKKKGDRMVPNCVPVSEEQMEEDLRKWFREKWVRFGPDGKIRGACARGDSSEGKPKCLPQSKAHALGKKGRASAAAKKRREDPNPERRGPARNVATKVKEDDDKMDQAFRGHRIEVEYPEGKGRSHIYHRREPMYLKDIFSDANSVAARNRRATINLYVNDEYIPNYEWQDGVEMPSQGIGEATGDQKFDTMLGRIVDPVAALSQDRVYEEQLEDYVFEFMNEFLNRMDRLGIEVWLDNPRAGEDLTNPKFLQAYEQASVKAVQRFMQGKKLDVNNQRLMAKVKADFDENADQVNPVAGFLGTFMQGFTTLRPGEIDVLNKSGMLKKPGDVDDQQLEEKQDACYRKVKSRYKVWPSAYASGALVQCRKKGAANWGNKTKK